MATKPNQQLTLRDRLSRLSHADAVRDLGPDGENLLIRGSRYHINLTHAVAFIDGGFEVRFYPESDRMPTTLKPLAWTRISIGSGRRLRWWCSNCPVACEHVGAAFSTLLNHKLELGLSISPAGKVPLEHLSGPDLLLRAVDERRLTGMREMLSLVAVESEGMDGEQNNSPCHDSPWRDYIITSHDTGESHRLAIRGLKRGDNYCSCADYRNNTLGMCAHTDFALSELARRHGDLSQWPISMGARDMIAHRFSLGVCHDHDHGNRLRLSYRGRLSKATQKLVRPLVDGEIRCAEKILSRLRKLEQRGFAVTIYPDAAEHLARRRFAETVAPLVTAIERDPVGHPLRQTLLREPLLPYQLAGIGFALNAGRCILADDMGLGKTIQAIGLAELLVREAGIAKVLVVCPASVKSQWKAEIERFSERSAQIVSGPAKRRCADYANESLFSICNYEQVLRDLTPIELVDWDLIILDEGQRIKNRESKTAIAIKRLQSRFVLVLTGTPIENRLDDLFSIAEFVDNCRLGPAFRFFHRHRVVSEHGRVLAYHRLGELRVKLRPILLRRTRAEVAKQLPPRTTSYLNIPATAEQARIDRGYRLAIRGILDQDPLTEEDMIKMRQLLLCCRLAADSSSLVHKDGPVCSSKLNALGPLFDKLFVDASNKIILFSEWTSMLSLIESMLKKRNADYVRLDGSIPASRRQGLVDRFESDSNCRVFLTSNAGAVGINVQAANIVINVDLPWNPAVLEQRIGRAHRLGQTRPVSVYILITDGTIEERMLNTLSLKSALFDAVLNPHSNVEKVTVSSSREALLRRMEVLTGAKAEVPISETARMRASEVARQLGRTRLAGHLANEGKNTKPSVLRYATI